MVERFCHFSMNNQLSRALFVAQGPGYAIKRKSDTLITQAKLEEIEELSYQENLSQKLQTSSIKQ